MDYRLATRLALILGSLTPVASAQTTQPERLNAPAESEAVVSLATAAPQELPPLSATMRGCQLSPLLKCAGPTACFCQPPLYYGTFALDDDWTNPVLECAGGRCGAHWYRYSRNMVQRKDAWSQHTAGAIDLHPCDE
jgi:hypothetical protein